MVLRHASGWRAILSALRTALAIPGSILLGVLVFIVPVLTFAAALAFLVYLAVTRREQWAP